MVDYTYSRDKRGIVVRSDGALIPENDSANPATILFREWLADGNALPSPLIEDGGFENYPHTEPPPPGVIPEPPPQEVIPPDGR